MTDGYVKIYRSLFMKPAELSEIIYQSGEFVVPGSFFISQSVFCNMIQRLMNGDLLAFKKCQQLHSLIHLQTDSYFSKETIELFDQITASENIRDFLSHDVQVDSVLKNIELSRAFHAHRESYEFRRAEANRHINKPAVRRRIFKKYGHKCALCNSTKALAIDHKTSVLNGGGNDDDNLQALCQSCNSRKGAN